MFTKEPSPATVQQRAGQRRVSARARQSRHRRLCDPDFFRKEVRGAGLVKTNKDSVGIPQGSPMSALLSNLYLLEFDHRFNELARKYNAKYLRYCDDVLVIVDKEHASIFENLIYAELERVKLKLQEKKSAKVDFSKIGNRLAATAPLQYLGFTFDGGRVLIRSASLARYQEKMLRGIRVVRATARKRNEARMRRGEDSRPVFLKKVFARYSHLGRRNFITYGYSAARELQSQSMRRQLRRYWRRIKAELQRE
jgi:hypothetical protein